MGVAKRALEASVRYLALTSARGIRSTRFRGAVRTLAGSVIGDARHVRLSAETFAAGTWVTLDELGGSALYLLSDLSRRDRRNPLCRFRLNIVCSAAGNLAPE